VGVSQTELFVQKSRWRIHCKASLNVVGIVDSLEEGAIWADGELADPARRLNRLRLFGFATDCGEQHHGERKTEHSYTRRKSSGCPLTASGLLGLYSDQSEVANLLNMGDAPPAFSVNVRQNDTSLLIQPPTSTVVPSQSYSSIVQNRNRVLRRLCHATLGCILFACLLPDAEG